MTEIIIWVIINIFLLLFIPRRVAEGGYCYHPGRPSGCPSVHPAGWASTFIAVSAITHKLFAISIWNLGHMYHLKRKNPIDFGHGRIQDGRLGRQSWKQFFVINGKPLIWFQLFLVITFLTPGELFRDDDQMVSCFQFTSLIIRNMYDLFHSMAGDSPSLMVYFEM